MSHCSRRLGAFAVVVAALALAVSSARAATDSVDFIQTRQFLVTALLRLRPNEQRDRQVSAVLDRTIAFDAMAKRSLPDRWEALSEGQHAEYTAMIKRFVQRQYEKSLVPIVDYRFEFTSEDLGVDGVMVHARATSGRADRNHEEVPVAIDYHLSPTGSSFKVVDITAGGSRFVQEFKSKFQRILETDGFDALIEQMKNDLGV